MAIGPGARITKGDEVWTIGAEFKRGGFGVIYLASQTKPVVREAVVKFPADHLLADPIAKLKFQREAQIAANLRHRNVVRVLGVWNFPDGQVGLLQELVEGAKTLAMYLSDPNVDRLGVLLQALYGLRAIHGEDGKGFVHRDIAPQNVLVNADGVVKIIDFGLAMENPRGANVLTATGCWFGTPGCIAPETKVDARKVDGRADLFGLGKAFAAGLQCRDPEDVELDRLPLPWRDMLRPLCERDRDDRPPNVDEALSLVMQAATAAGASPHSLLPHAQEVAGAWLTLEGWPAFCNSYFARQIRTKALGFADIEAASLLTEVDFRDPAFDADALLDYVLGSQISATVRRRGLNFEAIDPYGRYLRLTYSALTVENRLRCFRELVRAAIDYHRYELMGFVRSVYASETELGVTAALVAILNKRIPSPSSKAAESSPGPGRSTSRPTAPAWPPQRFSRTGIRQRIRGERIHVSQVTQGSATGNEPTARRRQMADFIVRVELHTATSTDYDKLHTAMVAQGFSRNMKGSDNFTYQLPTAEYAISADMTAEDVRVKASTAGDYSGRSSSILVAQWSVLRWSGLNKVQ